MHEPVTRTRAGAAHDALPRELVGELEGLCDALRAATSRELARHDARALLEVRAQGAGDVTFALDVPCERAIERWHARLARRAPLSVLTEERGWLHLGPRARGGVRELATFDHGGWRVVIDPIDGTRNLAAGLRSAWTAVALAPRGALAPRMSDVCAGILSELPTPAMRRWRRLSSCANAPCVELHELGRVRALRRSPLRAPRGFDARAPGYWSFFRYTPAQRPWLAELEARFFERMRRAHALELRHVFDDQYISNAGQLALLALGTYRMVVDARAFVATRARIDGTSSKPYDVAAAIALARAAGCVVRTPDGAELDFELDAASPVSFAGYANARIARACEPILRDELRAALARAAHARAAR